MNDLTDAQKLFSLKYKHSIRLYFIEQLKIASYDYGKIKKSDIFIPDLTNEKWLNVRGFEDCYEVSDCGRVRSLDRTCQRESTGLLPRKGQIIKSYLTPRGYLRIQLTKNSKQKNVFVHRLVADAFIEKIYGKNYVNHKNSNRTDNTVSNLEWCTLSENSIHSYEFGNQKACSKYIYKNIDFDIITDGSSKMANILYDMGYKNINSAGIYRAGLNSKNTHLDLKFEAYPKEQYGTIPFSNKMNLVELITMLVDWYVCAKKYNLDLNKMLEINKDRFGISDQLHNILKNTLENYF